MSKLFNTLEKIRHHETSGSETPRRSSSRKPQAAGKSAPPRFLVVMLVAMLAVVVVYSALLSTQLNLTPLTTNLRSLLTALHLLPTQDGKTIAPTVATAPGALSQNQPTLPASAAQQAVQLTRTGIDFFQKGDTWRAIHFFDQARQKNPQAVEPLINMAVALSELGLYGPANRLFREAYAMAPNDPALLRNLTLLAEAGRLDDALLQKLPRHATQPSPRGR